MRVAIQGNICRCTGYVNIVEAVVAAGRQGHDGHASPSSRRKTLEKGFVGQSIPRKEDRRLVQGQGTFFDDVRRHGMGYVHFVRSPYAHAKIVSIDVSKALELEGVYGTITGDEVAIHTDPFFEMSVEPGGNIKDYALAVGRVRHMGEPVAAVCAATRELARDAAELIEVEYDPLPVLVDAEEALKDEVVLHDDAGSNVVWSGVFDWGDVDTALAEADHVVKIDRLHFHRFSSTPLECAGALVEYDKGTGEWTLHVQPPDARRRRDLDGAGAAHGDRQAPLRHARHRRRLRQQDLPAPAVRRPLPAWRASSGGRCSGRSGAPTSTRRTRTATSARSSTSRSAVMADGTMTGFKVRALDDCGAFPRYEPLGCIIWAQVTPGMYGWRNIRVDFTQVCTNKSPVSPNRGYSRMQHLWLTERIVDIVAHRARPRPGRGAQAQLREDRADAVRDAERLRLRLRRLRGRARHRARPHRPRVDRGAARRRRRRAGSSSASASARRSTRGRTTSASRRS